MNRKLILILIIIIVIIGISREIERSYHIQTPSPYTNVQTPTPSSYSNISEHTKERIIGNKAILYEDLVVPRPERTKEQLVTIVQQTNASLIIRAAMTFKKVNQTDFNTLKDNIAYIKKSNPDVLIIGNAFWQVIGKEEQDLITELHYTSSQIYEKSAFEPTEYGIIGVTKLEYQCYNGGDCPKAPDEAKTGIVWIPDITKSLTRIIFKNKIEHLLKTGVDGIWIDIPFMNAEYLKNSGANSSEIQKSVNGTISLINEIRNLKTYDNKSPIIATWIPKNWLVPYLKKSPEWPSNNKYFDFLTESLNHDEIIYYEPNRDRTLSEDNRYRTWSLLKDDIRTNFGNIPLITYIDWGFGRHPLWWFSQWYPDVKCCSDFQKRKNHQIRILETFSPYFNGNNITFAYPVHGGEMCNIKASISEIEKGPCYIKSFGIWNTYDSLAPEFETYDKIVELINKN